LFRLRSNVLIRRSVMLHTRGSLEIVRGTRHRSEAVRRPP